MIQSRPVDVDGRFVGVGVNASSSWHFVALDPVLDDLHGAHFPTLEQMRQTARAVLERARRSYRAGLPHRAEDRVP